MNNPLFRLKAQPWKQLFIIAFITIIIVSSIDYILISFLENVPSFKQNLFYILPGAIKQLLPLVTGIGLGALGVFACERFQPRLFLNAGSLWALVLCLIVTFAVTMLIPLPSFLVRLSYPAVLGLMVGVFWKGRPYWR